MGVRVESHCRQGRFLDAGFKQNQAKLLVQCQSPAVKIANVEISGLGLRSLLGEEGFLSTVWQKGAGVSVGDL